MCDCQRKATGPAGPQGETGPQGDAGDVGFNGAYFYTGTGNPTDSTGLPYGTYNGTSQYLDVSNLGIWWKSIAGWHNVSNILGPDGTAVNLKHVLYKVEAPDVNFPQGEWVSLGSFEIPTTALSKGLCLHKIFYRFNLNNNSADNQHLEIRVKISDDVILLCRESLLPGMFSSVLTIDSRAVNLGTSSENYIIEIRRSSNDVVLTFDASSALTLQVIY